jgi:FdhD protein
MARAARARMSSLGSTPRRHSVRQLRVHRIAEDAWIDDDVVATEEPLEIRLAYAAPDGTRAERSISITMRTPGNDEELAAGFLLTEGIVRRAEDVVAIEMVGPPAPNGLVNVVRVALADNVTVELDRLERHFYTSSSCGVCGKASLAAVAVQGQFAVRDADFSIDRALLGALPRKLVAEQSVFAQTGGLHASGLFDARGNIVSGREDVGRHNALDKLIGSGLLRAELPLRDYGILVSGRASFELMQKAMMAGCPFVAAVGAPSSLAVELAHGFGMTLVGFLKQDRFNIYAGPHRVL